MIILYLKQTQKCIVIYYINCYIVNFYIISQFSINTWKYLVVCILSFKLFIFNPCMYNAHCATRFIIDIRNSTLKTIYTLDNTYIYNIYIHSSLA